MVTKLEDRDWDLLLQRIRDGKCTPFLGAGACHGILPLGSDIARRWAKQHNYPQESSSDDLIRVSQYLAVQNDPMYPKEQILREMPLEQGPDFSEKNEPHAILADLPLPVYLTTNYDDFMVRALRNRNRQPQREFCHWNDLLKSYTSAFSSPEGYMPTVATPVVFHFHGHTEYPESLVLTEDDYLEFMVNLWKEGLVPPRIRQALSGSSLLFMGYGLADWNFRVLFQGLVTQSERSLRRISVAVQMLPLPDNAEDSAKQVMREYLTKYFDHNGIRVYWGTAREFAAELRQRWEEFSSVSRPS